MSFCARRAAIAQLCATNNKLQNLLNVARCAGMARQQGASILFLPECFGFIGTSSEETLQQAEPPIMEDSSQNSEAICELLKQTVQIPSDDCDATTTTDDDDISLLDGLKTIAVESNLWISGGGMHEAGAPSEQDEKPRVYNSHVILDNQGNVQAIYRKTHLFDVSIPNKVNLRESATTAPGTRLVVCDSPIGKLGLTTCYDVRFPEMYVELARNGGAQILLVPSAFTVPTGNAHWHILLRARAIETQCYVFAAAQFGRHNDKRESYGHSLAVDPWGRIVADAGGSDGPGTLNLQQEPPSIVVCDVDVDEMESIRERMPIQQHRDAASFEW
jgi:predicted amidohydrolase